MNDKSIDDEFERIISGLENESDPEMGTDSSQPSSESSDLSENEPELDESTDSHDSNEPEDASEDSAEAAEEPQNLDEPEDEHLHLEGGAAQSDSSSHHFALGRVAHAGHKETRWIVPIANQITCTLNLTRTREKPSLKACSAKIGDAGEVDRFARVIRSCQYGATWFQTERGGLSDLRQYCRQALCERRTRRCDSGGC